jgi:hypothetical protein
MMKAFPSIDWDSQIESKNNQLTSISSGMDLRDYFAAKAMQAMIGNCEGSNFDDFVIAQEAYQMADFMMTERESHGKQSQ